MSNDWYLVDSLPPLEPDELQLWRIDLTAVDDDQDIYRKHLSPTEVDRAARLRAGQVRQQFLVGRACLRILLGNLLNQAPNLVPITFTIYGKPETPAAAGDPPFFNVAHSRDTILIALCRSSPVGIDLEYLDRETEILDIARDSFTRDELSQIERAAGPGKQQRAFFCCWTRKEAVIKADGRGLSLPLDSVEVPVVRPASASPVILPSREPSAQSETWFVTDIQLGDSIVGAVAVSTSSLRPSTFLFPFRLLLTNSSDA